MKFLLSILFSGIFFTCFSQDPLKAEFRHSATYRWLNKEVLNTRMLDDMESVDHWTAFTRGAQQIVDARVVTEISDVNRVITEMTLTKKQSHDGGQSLCVRIPSKLNVPGPESGRGWGTAGVRRKFDGEDWSGSNRISLWVYPECPGFYVNWLELRVANEGVEKLPALFGQEGETSILLRNGEWNHVVWEIGNVARDKITNLEISYYMSGNEPEAPDTATYYFDQLELQKVEPDHIEGWDIWPGRISYSHTGYQTGATKTAIVSGDNANNFRLIDQETGETVLSKSAKTVETHLGRYQLMDFSEVRQTGSYIIESGDLQTKPFRIDPNVWRETILKTLNFFYAERCGMAIPGVHGACHRDWTCINGDKTMVVNGGWHDAGDLTQGLGNTGEAVYAMFSLAERLHGREEDPELYQRLLEEAQWGLDWVLKTSFRNGYRNGGHASSRRTNGIMGDFDDITATASNRPMDHLVASAAEAIAYRVLYNEDPQLANYALEMAQEDWQFAVEGMDFTKEDDSGSIFRGSFDSDNVVHELASAGIMAAIELWKATNDQGYADKAIEWAKIIVDSQQRTKPDWDIPLTGFFYTSPAKEHLLHYCHRGREQAPILALTQLCEQFPHHPDWMTWYSSVTLYAQYLKTVTKYTAPFGVLPASVYSDKEYLLAPKSRRESYRKQVLNGIPIGEGHYLRLFPVWMDYRGHFGTILPQAQALINAANLRGDLESAQLAQLQLEWIIGRNPFAQSTMWGEGHDFTPLYTVLSGDIVGGLPVGIQTQGDKDIPYWPVQSTWTYKEIWTHPVIRWLWLMRDLAGPAIVEGKAHSAIELTEITSGQQTTVQPHSTTGTFRATVPEGRYTVRCEGEEHHHTFLPAAKYTLDLRKGRTLDIKVSSETIQNGLTINCVVRGSGSHKLDIRTNNLTLKRSQQELSIKPGVDNAFEWRCRITNPGMPWVAVIVPDDDMSLRQEIRGAAWEQGAVKQ